ncbi:hypothetical protein DN748_09635 [Sinomicrobium soli]|nr:hypothetical protein DN748_09635 [Sinomicrobium sp. N-1-3-6]
MIDMIKISGIILLAAICSLALGEIDDSRCSESVHQDKQELYSEINSGAILNHFIRTKSSVSGGYHTSFSFLKFKVFDGLSTLLAIDGNTISAVFGKSPNVPECFAFHDRQSKIIFPFHNFW